MEDVLPRAIFPGSVVTDTVVSTWIMMIIIIGAAIVVRHRFPVALEKLIDFLSSTVSDVMERPAGPYLPFLGALTIFIAAANVLSILPAIPLPGGKMLPIVSPTRDINTPAALAITVFFSVHIFGIWKKGVWHYFKDLASPLYLAPLMFPLEIFGQLSRTLSLTLRLFGNILSGELLVAVIFSMAPLVVPLPLTVLGLFTGLLQAYIFTTLAAVFIGAAVRANE